MNFRRKLIRGFYIFCLLAAGAWSVAASDGLKSLPGHLRGLPADRVAGGTLAGTNELRLAIGLPLRDAAGLDDFLAQVYDPTSTNYQHYLTPEEFTARFSPDESEYAAVVAFARTNHLTVTATQGNRRLLDVTGSAADIEKAFHINLLTYPHPTEHRDYYAPDAEPSVAAGLAIADVSGLNNYARPHPFSHVRPAAAGAAANATGSGSSGTYIGNDFRAAYLPGVTLTGAGQIVGLVQFDGFYAVDINNYATAAGLSTVPIQTVLLDGYSGTPTTGPNSGNVEVSLDIEMVMSMAPGLSKIMVFEAGSGGIPNDILNAMVASNQVKQLSCSWGWAGGPSATTDAIFKQMAAQGQSFFLASGDSDAFTTGSSSANGVDNTSLDNTPSSNPYITMVGGTTLTTDGAGGSWSAETVWNWGLYDGSYVGSSGGISSYYTIPSWQTNLSMTSNGGSTSYRNIPDVALTADNVYVTYSDGSSTTVGGTSCASPLWAGLAALINQQAVAGGKTNVGFLNPAIYALGKSAAYAATFHDTTNGNNFSSNSTSLFVGTNGYDLCTGWGTPSGQALINALSGVTNWLFVTPGTGFAATGPVGGAFSPNTETLVLSNGSSSSLAWSLINTSSWLAVSTPNGTLPAGGVVSLSAGLAAAASSLTPGVYTAPLVFTNHSGGIAVSFSLSVGQSLIANGGFEQGSLTDWTFSGNTTIGFNVYDAVESSSSSYSVVHSGTYGLFLGDTKLASLSQSFTTVPGQYYLVSLWLDNPTSGTVQQFIVDWNTSSTSTNVLYNVLNPAAFTWTNLQFLASATGTNTTLQILAENDPNYFGLDDVSVTPVPSPVFKSQAKSSNSLQLSWVTSTGLVYQVQYKTNLLKTNWLNLVAALTATNYSTTLLDTNALLLSPQRFYRLSVAP